MIIGKDRTAHAEVFIQSRSGPFVQIKPKDSLRVIAVYSDFLTYTSLLPPKFRSISAFGKKDELITIATIVYPVFEAVDDSKERVLSSIADGGRRRVRAGQARSPAIPAGDAAAGPAAGGDAGL